MLSHLQIYALKLLVVVISFPAITLCFPQVGIISLSQLKLMQDALVSSFTITLALVAQVLLAARIVQHSAL
jgi:hypothetical protein